MRSRSRLVVMAAVFGAACLLASCSSGSSSPTTSSSNSTSTTVSSTPFRVLAIVAETGPLAAINTAEMQGLKAAAKYINANGGIVGHQVQVTVVNDNLDPTTAASDLEQAISSGNLPNLVFAGTTSNETLALVPILNAHKLLSIQLTTSAQTIDPSKYPYAFTVASSTANESATLAAAVKSEYPNAKKVGIIIGNDVNGTSLLEGEKAALEADGFQVVDQTYDPTTTIDMTPQLEALRADNPQVLVASGFGAVAGYILQGRAKIGWNVPVVGDASFSANPIATMVPKADLTGVVIATTKTAVYQPPSSWSPAFKTFVTYTEQEGANFSQGIGIYSLSWDVLILAKMAATQANSLDSSAMVSALQALKQPAHPQYVSFPVEGYSPTLHSTNAPASLATVASVYLKMGMFLPVGSS
ncbi:MAG: ABC transporter substrate-binding protein [Acidimicrobiales bacterium]